MSLQETKDQYAKERSADNWEHFLTRIMPHVHQHHYDIVSERYAQQRVNEVKNSYKECFEMFIPEDKWDEATMFLSTDNGFLPEDFLTRNPKTKEQ